MKVKFWLIAALLTLVIGIFVFCVPIDNKSQAFVNLQLLVNGLITIFIPLITIILIVAGIAVKKLVVQLERLNIGGVNLLFNTPEIVYKNSGKAFLESKRSLFYINPDEDNFKEVFDSYYETYKFFREELSFLKHKKQKKQHDQASEILKHLNLFLTSNQNNYRRWFEAVSNSDKITYFDEKGKEKKLDKSVHMMKIGEVQKYYYDYDKLINDFSDINNFFRETVATIFDVKHEKWKG